MDSVARKKEYFRLYYIANRKKKLEQAHQYAVDNRDKILAYKALYRLTHKDKIIADRKSFREKHRNKMLAYQVVYRKANPDALKKWALAHPEEWKIARDRASHLRRARKAGAPIGRAELKEVQERHGKWCGICQNSIAGKFHYDHITPLSKGGTHTTDNIQLAHPTCNMRKGSKIL